MTALHCAARAGHLEVLEFLLDSGALIDARCHRLIRPLHWAAMYGHLDVVRMLLERGAQVDPRLDRALDARPC